MTDRQLGSAPLAVGARGHDTSDPTPLPQLIAMDLAVAALHSGSFAADPLLLLGARRPMPDEIVARWEGTIVIHEAVSSPAAETTPPAGVSRALWIAPQPPTWKATAAALDRRLQPGGRLAVIGSGPLAHLMRRVRPKGLGPAGSALHADRVGTRLGYTTFRQWRLYGLRSATWALVRLGAEGLRRDDLADRCEAAFGQSMIEPAHPRLWCIGVWVGVKPSQGKGSG